MNAFNHTKDIPTSTIQILFLWLIFTVSGFAQQQGSTYITVYNDNLGVVRDVRSMDIARGASRLQISNVAAMLNPATVKINFRGKVLEQNYQFDLVSADKILQRYIDRKVDFVDEQGNIISGTLLSVQGGTAVVRKEDGGLNMLTDMGKYRISVDELPGGLITRPTLVWSITADRAGKQDVELIYQTGGMSWQAEYVAVLKDKDTKMDLNAWVNLTNNSGASFQNARLKLVAGSVNRAQPEVPRYRMEDGFVMAASPYEKGQFESSGLFEYYLYTLQRPTDVLNNESKQIALFDATNIPVTKRYRYSEEMARGMGSSDPVSVQVDFVNSAANGLGMPLPKGIVRMNQSAGESLEFIGEDRIQHTPKDEKISISLGQAFDVLGETTLTEQRRMSDKVNESSYKIVLKNRKDSAVTIEVERNMGTNWEITKKSHEFRRINAQRVVFDIRVPAGGEVNLSYTVRVTN